MGHGKHHPNYIPAVGFSGEDLSVMDATASEKTLEMLVPELSAVQRRAAVKEGLSQSVNQCRPRCT